MAAAGEMAIEKGADGGRRGSYSGGGWEGGHAWRRLGKFGDWEGGGQKAYKMAAGKAAMHDGGWGEEIFCRKVAGGEGARMAAAGKAAMHGGGWGDGDWEGGWRRAAGMKAARKAAMCSGG
jgi:hypothetical protein